MEIKKATLIQAEPRVVGSAVLGKTVIFEVKWKRMRVEGVCT